MSTYIFKRDREFMKKLQIAINDATGVDRDEYLEEKSIKSIHVAARNIWIYEVYKNTMLTIEDIAEYIDRHHSNVVRSIKKVQKWKRTKCREKEIIKQIELKIK